MALIMLATGTKPFANTFCINTGRIYVSLPYLPAWPEMNRFCLTHAENHRSFHYFAVGMCFSEDIHTLHGWTSFFVFSFQGAG